MCDAHATKYVNTVRGIHFYFYQNTYDFVYFVILLHINVVLPRVIENSVPSPFWQILGSKFENRVPVIIFLLIMPAKLSAHNAVSIIVHGPRGVTCTPPPRILHEWYHFVQGTPLINNRDVNAL